MKKTRIAINGFGRIGRQFFKVAFDHPQIDIVAINDLADIENIAYLLEFDTVYGRYEKKVEIDNGALIIDGKVLKYISEPDPSKLPWREMDVDVVVESTGFFASYEKSKAHLEAGAKRVVISAPAKDDDETVTSTPNVNELFLEKSKITSNASCTTNAITPIASIMLKNPGMEYSILNTLHGYTASQKLVDGPDKKDFRRGRAGATNIIPTSTGAAIATSKAIPEMKDKFDGLALRLPLVIVSVLDFTFVSKKKTSVEEINRIFTEEAAKPEWKGILEAVTKPIVSSDIIRNPHGAIVDLNLTKVVGEKLVKIIVWYDNEWGYVNMLLKHILSVTPFL